MGFQLGPKLLRRPPRGWRPAQVTSLQHRSYDQGSNAEGGSSEIDTSMALDVLWRVEVPGEEPYEVHDEDRRAPTWVHPNFLGGGNRWYKVRLRPQSGLVDGIALPCFVDPKDPGALWIDWDGAYERHEPAWEKQARVDRAVAGRKSRYEQAWDKVTNPFAGRAQEDEEQLADAVISEEAATLARQVEESHAMAAQMAQDRGMGPDEEAEHRRRMDEANRIYESGRPARAVVVAQHDTGRKIYGSPLILITLEVQDGGTTRRVEYEHVWGPRHAKRYKVGREIDVRIDLDDPDVVALAS